MPKVESKLLVELVVMMMAMIMAMVMLAMPMVMVLAMMMMMMTMTRKVWWQVLTASQYPGSELLQAAAAG